jgi:hypothetical protein
MIDLSWLNPTDIKPKKVEGHMLVTKEVERFWRSVKKLTSFKNVMEIGFNAGHSSSFLLSLFPDVRVDSYDICWHSYTKPNSLKVKDKFGNRFNFCQTDSKNINPEEIKEKSYDLIFVDGNHKADFVENDFQIAFKSQIPFMVVDDLHQKDVSLKFEEHSDKYEVIHRGLYKATTGQMVQIACVKLR